MTFPDDNFTPEPLSDSAEPEEEQESSEVVPSPVMPPQPAAEPPVRRFEDLSLADLIGNLIFNPARTVSNLNRTLTPVPEERIRALPAGYMPGLARPAAAPIEIDWQSLIPFLAMAITFLVTGVGGFIMFQNRQNDPNVGALPPGSLLMLFGMITMAVIAAVSTTMTPLPRLITESIPFRLHSIEEYISSYGIRIAMIVGAVIFTAGAWVFNTDNQFTSVGVLCWIASIGLWTALLYEGETRAPVMLTNIVNRVVNFFRRPITFRVTITLILMIIILIVGFNLRYGSLSTYPPDMTSDHVEKLLDAHRIFEGARPIFMERNGGRESFHFYFLAILESITHWTMDFNFLKIAAGVWGMLGIVAAWWAGRSIFGEDDPPFGNMVGIFMAGLVAISYWAVLLDRLSLRIILTPLVTTILLVFLVRAFRHNRRSDYIVAGFVLGWGVYCYQACRMLPLVAVAGGILFLIFRVRSWATLRKFIVNFAAMVIISIAIFVPLAHYAVEYPGNFWSRTTGRMVGYDTYSGAALPFDQFMAQLKDYIFGTKAAGPGDTDHPGLLEMMRQSLFMFNYRGDTQWFTGTPNDAFPQLDLFAGTLFVLGLGIIIARMIRRRDPTDWLLLVSIPILVLPAALAVAFPAEVPSATRASGALPVVYLLAALALAVIVREVETHMPLRTMRYLVYAIIVILFILADQSNVYAYFDAAMPVYRQSSQIHHQAGQILKNFNESVGSPGNSFLMGYPYWFDDRALGIESGDINWANGVDEQNPPSPDRSVEWSAFLDKLKQNVHTAYEFKPDRYILFFVNQSDQPMLTVLAKNFPQGWVIRVPADMSLGSDTNAQANPNASDTTQTDQSKDFYLFVSPPVGCDWVNQNLGGIQPCNTAPGAVAYPGSVLVAPPTPTPTLMPLGTPVPAGTGSTTDNPFAATVTPAP